MRKIIFVVLLLFPTICYSQYSTGSFTLPKTEKYVVLDWNFKWTLFDGKYNEKEWETLIGVKEWEEAKKEALGLLLFEMNDKMSKSRITMIKSGSNLPSSYTIYICPEVLNRKGDNTSYFVLKENKTGKELGRCRIKGDGGHFGTLGNLLGDGYEEAARKMGKILKSKNRK